MPNYLTDFSAAAQTYVVSLTGDDCTRSKWDTARHAFDAGAASVPPAEPITTAAQLDALPGRSVVLSEPGWAFQKNADKDAWYLGFSDRRWTADEVADYRPLTLLAPASPPVPAPVLLTDPEDPRIRPGARVRYVSDHCVGDGFSPFTVKQWVKDSPTEVYLIAEAPDPDAEVLDAMEETEGRRSDEALAHLRALGYDVVKRADA